MKKVPKKKHTDDNFKRITHRNWIIFAVALLLFLFFSLVFPMAQEILNERG